MRKRFRELISKAMFLLKKQDLKSYVIFLLLFGLMKISTFVAPLLLSNLVLDTADYGLIEYVLSLGIILATPFSVGMHGAYPYYNIKLKKIGYQSIFYAHGIFISGIFLLCGLLYFIGIIELKVFFAMMIGAIISMQFLLSSIFKSHEIIKKSVIIDGGLFLVINIFNILLWWKVGFSVRLLMGILSIYLVGLLFYFISKYVSIRDFSFSKYKEAAGFGVKLVLSGFLILLLTGSARVIIEYFLGLEAVAIYGFYFRLAAAVVMIHQVVNIAFFKKIYEAPPSTLDKYFSIFLSGIFIMSIILWFVIPIVAIDLFDILRDTYLEQKGLYYIVSFQVVFWICLALNENIIFRENLANELNIFFSIIALSMLACLFALNYFGLITLNSIVILNLIFIYFGTEVQFFLLKKYRHFSFPKTRLTNLIIFVFFITTYNLL